MNVIHMYEQAADSYSNLLTVYKDKVASALEELHTSSIVRIRDNTRGKFACAIFPCHVHVLFPSMFMVWDEVCLMLLMMKLIQRVLMARTM
jgi:hypothetical protein